MGNRKGTTYNTPHKSKNLKGYLKLYRVLAKVKDQEPLGGKSYDRRADCVHYCGMLSAAALGTPKPYDCPKDCKAYDCPKDCKKYKKRDRR